jgi:hypothetical protein
LQIKWADGDTEIVLLNGSGAGVESNAARLVYRKDGAGVLKRLIFQNASAVKIDEKVVFQSSEPVSASFQMTESNRLRADLEVSKAASIKLVLPISPKSVKLNGRAVKFDFEKSSKTLILQIPAGKNLVESE